MGYVTRDDQGRVLMVATQLETLNDDLLEVELQAILKGMQLCLPMGVRKLTVETDCLVAVQVLDAGPDSYACYRHLLYEILSFKDCFEAYNSISSSRVGYRVAHLLARYVRNVESTSIWWNSPPEFILSALRLDSNCNT